MTLIVLLPNFLKIACEFCGPIPNFCKKPTICQESKFSVNFSQISSALSEVIPLITTNFSGSFLITLIVSSPNCLTIFLAILGPIPLIIPFDKYFSKASSVLGIIFSKLSTLN